MNYSSHTQDFNSRLLIILYLLQTMLTGQPGQKSGEEQEGFYLLKKDSQRRMTLTRVLNQDEAKICEVWMRGIYQAEGQTVLQMVLTHFNIILRLV